MKKPWEMKWGGVEFSSLGNGKIIKVAHNFEDDEMLFTIFKVWVKDAEVKDAKHFADYITTLREAGLTPYYVVAFDEFKKLMEAIGIEAKLRDL